jgi:glycosyltransferase involved in cell wall biosynthesis
MKPRIVILSAFATPFRSGAEACSEEVPTILRDRYDFTIVTAKLRRDLPRSDRLGNGIAVVRVGMGMKIDKWLFPFIAPFAARRLKPDIIHAVLESFAGLALVFCRWICPSAKRILTCQSTNTSLFLRAMHRSADALTVISNVLLERAESLGREDAVLIPNGMHVARLQEAVGRIPRVAGRVLFVGRLEQMKGIDTLLRAFAALRIEHISHLRIVGGGSLCSSLEALARELGIADRVTFVGFVPVPAIYEEFAAAEIFAGLSRSEALGNVFLEAQAAGCAVVGTRVGGIPDSVTDGETGLLVPPDDPAAAREALERLINDAGLREKLSDAGREHAKKYDWSVIAERYAEVYESVRKSS